MKATGIVRRIDDLGVWLSSKKSAKYNIGIFRQVFPWDT